MAKKHKRHEKSKETNEQKNEKINFFNNKKNEKWLIITLIIIAIGISTFFRMYPTTLPITNDWAANSLQNQIASQVSNQINAQYPNLPTAQKQQLINEQVAKVIEAQKDDFDKQIEQTSEYFKSQLQDENGNTYLLAIDPYLWYTEARNIENNGHPGTEITEEGKYNLELRNGREERATSFSLNPLVGVLIHKIGLVFNKNYLLQEAMFIIPVIIIGLAIIFAFFLARKIGGNLAGFVAGLAVGLNTSLLGRTPAGFSDTDAYIIMFPLLVGWLMLEAMTTKNLKKQLGLTALAAVALALFKSTWGSWWYIGSLLIGVMGIYFIYSLIINKEWKKWKTNFKKQILKTKSGQTIIIGISFLIMTGFFVAITGLAQTNEVNSFSENLMMPAKIMIIGPLGALSVKSVASGSHIWPNVLTTVAELNAGSWKQVIASVGGKLFFTIGILGVLLTFFLKTEDKKTEIRYAALLIFWFIGISAMGVVAARFIALLAAPFAIAFGVFFGISWTKGSKWIEKQMDLPKIITKIAILLVLVFLMVTPITTAKQVARNEVPSMNDEWFNSLTAIKDNCTDGVITSWWDFGHWFVNIAERKVTFDGGDQGKRIYWVGKSLMEENQTENKAILRMLNCGQNKGYELIDEYTNNSYLASKIINKIIYENKTEAKKQLQKIGLNEEEINTILEKTHCSNDELLDQYYIASQDMVGKSGVWSHFGSWNFDKAFVYNTFKNNDYDKAMNILLNETDYTEDQLVEMNYEINTLANNRAVDSWISPWPNYVTTSAKSCKETETEYICTLNQVINNQQNGQVRMEQAIVPKTNPENTIIKIGLYNGNQKVGSGADIIPKEVSILTNNNTKTFELDGSTLPYELSIAKTTKGIKAIMADPAIGSGTFTRLFFFEGIGMDGYEVLSDVTDFTGQRIIVYKVDLTN